MTPDELVGAIDFLALPAITGGAIVAVSRLLVMTSSPEPCSVKEQ